jgi:hypothetical protein
MKEIVCAIIERNGRARTRGIVCRDIMERFERNPKEHEGISTTRKKRVEN